MKCKHCGEEIADDSKFCEFCGKEVKRRGLPWWAILLIVIGVLGIASIVVILALGSAVNDPVPHEEYHGSYGHGDYVDLGLPSGTKWKDINETNPNDRFNFYTYDEAVQQFGDQLPTKEQFDELTENCTYVWDESARGCWFYGPNGNSIFLPAAGLRDCSGYVGGVGSGGFYWSSTPYGSEDAWDLYFNSGGVDMGYTGRCGGPSVRLVQD